MTPLYSLTTWLCRIFHICAASMALAVLIWPSTHAQEYPNKPIKFIVPFSAGSATDNLGRILAQSMGEVMGQPITVENKAGANGILGTEYVKSAPADGYTFLVTTSTTQAANVHLYRKLAYDPVKDFTPIGKIGETGFILMVNNEFPAKDMKEFLAFAKANPGKLAFGHGSSGSLVSAAMLTELAGLQTVNVPYKSIPPALTDLLGNQIQFAFADTGNAVSQMNGGRMRGLGVTTRKRASKAPQVPPIGETVKDYNVSAWFGLMAPANLPAHIQKKATATLMAVLAKPDVRDKIQGAGVDLDPEDANTFAKTIDAEIKKWGGWVKSAGIKPE